MRISEESYERIKSWAIPLEDTAEDAIRKILDAAEKHRDGQVENQAAVQESPAAYVVKHGAVSEMPPKNVPETQESLDAEEESSSNWTDRQPHSAETVAERMFVSLPNEFKLLSKGQKKRRGQIARKAYLERVGIPAIEPSQWARATGGRMHFVGYSSWAGTDRWFFGAREDLVERYLADNSLASFVFLCGLSDELIVAVPVKISQLRQLVRLGIFSRNNGQLKFHIKRQAGGIFFLDDRQIDSD